MSSTSVLLSILFLVACNEATADHATSKPPATPRETIARQLVIEELTPDVLPLTGRLTADQRADVTADTQGKVIAVYVKRGQRVKKGDPVVRLDVRSAAMQSAEAAANLASARAEKKNAEIECQRAERLYAQGAITRSEADRTATRCESAVSQVSAATARASVIAKGVSDGVVRAPFDGVVSSKAVNVGEWVAPGRALFTLVDAEPLTIELAVPESAVREIELGQPVTLTMVSAPGTIYRAKITRLAAEISSSRSMIAEATLEPTVDLVPGMFAEAEVVVGHTMRPVIPRSAAVLRGKDWHVFVVKETELEDRVVQIGPAATSDEVAVLANLAKDEIVVREPSPTTADGNVWSE